MQQTERVLLLVGDKAAGAALRTALEARGSQVRMAYDGLAALAALRADHYDLLVVEIESRGLHGLDLLATLPDIPLNASTPVMALVDPRHSQERLTLFQLGVDEVAVKPVSPLEFVTRARRLLSQASRAPTLLRGHVTAFLGAAGGIGVTTICANVAQILGGRAMAMLLDLAWPLGGVASLLALSPEPGLEGAAEEEYPAAAFPRYLVGGSPLLNYRLLPGLTRLPPSAPSPGAVAAIVREARTMASQVLVDLGTGGAPATEEILAEADTVVLVLGLERTHFALGRAKLAWLNQLGCTDRKRLVVANRTQPSPMGHRDAQRSLDEDVFVILPYEADRLSECLNQGRLVVAQYPSSAVTAALTELASAIERRSSSATGERASRGH